MGYSFESLKSFFSELGEPEYRAKQLLSWIHQKGVIDFDNMTDFNKDLRKKLNSVSIIKPPEIYKEYISDEGTKKYLIKLNSGSIISNVSKKLDYLIIGEKPTKRKVDAAKELKIRILDQKDFLKILNKTS